MMCELFDRLCIYDVTLIGDFFKKLDIHIEIRPTIGIIKMVKMHLICSEVGKNAEYVCWG